MSVPSVGQSHYPTTEYFKTSQGKCDTSVKNKHFFYFATQSIFHQKKLTDMSTKGTIYDVRSLIAVE